ncbi:tagatose-1,6-bisphosphate aldolase non-catalytic subunit AgaZ/GatZ [Clostridium saccharoperbutylacetonicum]|uniref:Tagatose 6 phosphate kinase n=1 Tax=Clostridium saccharoperbutylacetonicum N1-4(HMT) TaxID=931276 RepID=M1MUF4_9CLOT|nr:class II D-tagatose-bisphosphate aldolase, non-catalytic subunit [Clostridium saccharoperbutylacetonicum]AGF58301.1 tagatose 6 phosphate kinase [Clostridium saccharoperbutylacetonicum N1-4(HMT)]NRT60922.1 tagatose-1,6-bisphosphate aldolase non-catalytic subunit AgaZ/GatZ [Clostridium saccharoperbutylacetonicum]NSB24235.1 tagatose-1,6-bisphosphate aldolase non-catalytic subunit AgaZ/GatZ [Clostridium saccharoperbutylacetonicum]NSB43613.1 tagatose-1,6-bisphosphate aldolase non-catalytic subuni
MIREELERLIVQKRTLLGVGPMSTNCIDASIELANSYNVPIMLIASRRQIDSERFGGGYVNNWTTSQFADYVLDRDMEGKIILARDHGGPWQNPLEKEKRLGLRRAMESAKESYKADIEAGFQIIHIDPSVDIHTTPSSDEILDRVFELYEYCCKIACDKGKKIEFEIGTEEQSGSTSTGSSFKHMLEKVNKFCEKNKYPKPLFVVVQNGTRVIEMRNVGSFDFPVRVKGEIPPEIQVPYMSKICEENGVFMKAHNTDYLSDESLQWYPRLGIHSANIAPEFGVIETKSLIEILENNNLNELAENILSLSYNSKKWHKWMAHNTKASDREKAIIAGHYIFSDENFIEAKLKAAMELQKKNIILDDYLKENVKSSIMRYLINFRLVRK